MIFALPTQHVNDTIQNDELTHQVSLMLQWHTQHRLLLSLSMEVTTVEVHDLDWPQEKVGKEEEKGEGRDVRGEGQTPVYWGVTKETQLAILRTQVDRLNTCSKAKHSHTRLSKSQLLCKYCLIAKRPQGDLKIAASSNRNSVQAINRKLLEPSIHK